MGLFGPQISILTLDLMSPYPADVNSNDSIKTSDPNNPKIDTHNDTSVISFEFWCDGGRRVTLSRRAGRRTLNLME